MRFLLYFRAFQVLFSPVKPNVRYKLQLPGCLWWPLLAGCISVNLALSWGAGSTENLKEKKGRALLLNQRKRVLEIIMKKRTGRGLRSDWGFRVLTLTKSPALGLGSDQIESSSSSSSLWRIALKRKGKGLSFTNITGLLLLLFYYFCTPLLLLLLLL